MASASIEKYLVPEDADLPYEEAVLQNPFSVKGWLAYLEFKQGAPPLARNLLYERALREVPGSYKLWNNYLRERRVQVRGKKPGDRAYEALNTTFERCLVYLHKMPRIWLEYLEYLMTQNLIARARKTFDRALRSLSFGQHDRIWKLYTKFARTPEVPIQVSKKIYERYLKYNADATEEYINFLIESGEFDTASVQLLKLLNTEGFRSTPSGKVRQDLWLVLCDIISKNSDKIKSIKIEPIMRAGLTQFSDQAGKLWTALADHFIRMGHFERARDIFEEGMNKVITVKDFTIIWDAYAEFEDGLLNAQAASLTGDEKSEDETLEFDLRAARYEYLIDRQPLLLNSVLLRQNPHNVHEWLKRAQLYKNDVRMVAETYNTALATVDPLKAKGKPHMLWINYARFYEDHDDLPNARKIFDKAVKVKFKYVDDLATVWCEYAEMELRARNYERVRQVLEAACTPFKPTTQEEVESVQRKLYRSTKVWTFYADVEENFGTFQTVKAVYEKMFDLKVITPQVIINFASWLEENKHWEESFKIYEKGVASFSFPHVFDIWVGYLTKFIERYGGKKLERARELFEQVLEVAPAKDAKIFYVMYANLEEEFGLARRAMMIYERATKAVQDTDKFAIYSLYINRASEYFGVTRTREIYERAIETLPAKQAKDMCLRYAELERQLGEIDRARGVFQYGSQFCDPRLEPAYWQRWRAFEVDHGNEETFREMLRVKRSIQAQFNTQVNFMSIEAVQAANDMSSLEKKAESAQPLVRFQREEVARVEEAAKAAPNPEKIELGDEDEEEEEDKVTIEQLKVPQSVFERNVPGGNSNSSKEETESGSEAPKLGALARLKRKAE